MVEPGQSANTKIRKRFGDEVFHADGQLNRDKVGQIIFHDEEKRKQLNAIVHPEVQKLMMWQIFLHFLRGSYCLCM